MLQQRSRIIVSLLLMSGCEFAKTESPVSPAGSESTVTLPTKTTSWGVVVNADDATIVRVEGSAATMMLEGRKYTLGAAANERDAPRIMRPITGDFVATVRVVGEDNATERPAPGATISFHGEGLLLIGKTSELIRLERASFWRDGKLQRYVLFEQHLADSPVNGQNMACDGDPVTLKLERKGNLVHASFSTDGVKWESFGSNNSTISAGDVGVAALNTSSLPFLARFEGFHVESK